MLPESPVDTQGKPNFQAFVTWAFYACIVLIGWGILGKFDSLGLEVTKIRTEMTDMNVALVRTVIHQNFNDNEIQANRAAIAKLRDDVDALKMLRH